ncbi:putative membrane protein [Cronobacter phage EspYZU12]|uniref:Hypothetical membrane protein n=1 Tax=Salmonella phage PVPSE1 TaxID=889338 RepID=G3BM33_9CAUD|nr:hypothetical membrane protein [Salmonella phage PVPSE1]ADP02563.1 hypothetical membrane protein [Salmonella phage PVPSE1]WAK43652.1 putative membrane protein [Cronobacter phage EspYZU15]WAK45558.1 putative membrane protein [Cronobacter phage EspYZU14]WBF78342.1 putative membrane protein [Cronobacter phage EspYZU12]
MLEAVIGILGVAYAVIAVVYSIKMENDKVLRQIYKAKTDHDWSEICFAVGFAWPLGALVHYVMRRRNETA